MIRSGTAIRDITPPPGLSMSGFAARTAAARGAHDPLTVRVIAMEDTALVVVDVIGLEATITSRIRKRCCLPDQRVVIAATHTHGGPASMTSRLHTQPDANFLQVLEDACVEAIDQVVAHQVPARLTFTQGVNPDIARNRRDPKGPVDPSLPVLKISAADGCVLAVLVNYACHPVVLSANNNLWTSDYPHFVCQAIEEANPGALAVFLTSFVGDINTGHSARDSMILQATRLEPSKWHPTWAAKLLVQP